jgi:hypothetical protein
VTKAWGERLALRRVPNAEVLALINHGLKDVVSPAVLEIGVHSTADMVTSRKYVRDTVGINGIFGEVPRAVIELKEWTG